MNRLADERSPYLQQHADNPVDWYPWGEAAFSAARERDVPILLSIGYASCHWCHVMAHESFEDPDTAALLNERFVNVKVDREERPDVDAVYMTALQAMRGQGGWPLTAWLDAEGRPFYAGTYFPREDRQGMPSLRRVAEAITDAWRDRRESLLEDADRLVAHLEKAMEAPKVPRAEGEDDASRSEAALASLERNFDATHGGFGDAPKFPPHAGLRWCLQRPEGRAHQLAVATLRAMADGGLQDQLGGGFARYAVDARWHVPHFEKMLYDNAQLVARYAEAYRLEGEAGLREAAEGIVAWLAREMRLPDGGFASGLDADSEGEEGRFYVWTREAFDEAVGEDAPLARAAFGVGQVGELEGRHVLRRARSDAELADAFALETEEVRRRLAAARSALFAAREARERPGRDDKVLASWNGLAIGGLARAGRLLEAPEAVNLAQGAARFVLDQMQRDGVLWRRWHGGEVAVPGLLDDHAYLGLGLLELHHADGDPAWLEAARPLAEAIDARFADDDGSYRSTPADGEALLVRPRAWLDAAVPSDVLAASEFRWRLGRLLGDPDVERRAAATAGRVEGVAVRHPDVFGHALTLLDHLEAPPREVAVVGPAADPGADALWAEVARRPLDAWIVQRGHADGGHGSWPLLEGRAGVDGAAAAYVCERFACRTPITDARRLAEALDGAS